MTQNLVERVKSCGVSLASAALVGGLGFAGVDLCKLVPYRATYDWDLGNVAGILGASLAAGVFGYNNSDSILNVSKKVLRGVKSLTERVLFGKSVDGESVFDEGESEVKDKRLAVGCSRTAGAVLMLGGLSGMLLADKHGLVPAELRDNVGFEVIDKLVIAYNTRQPKYLPLERNLHFLENYVFNDILDGVPVPSDDLVSVNSDGSVDVSDFKKWNIEHYGDQMVWRFEGLAYSKPVFGFFDVNNLKGNYYFVFGGQIVGQASGDFHMKCINHPDSEAFIEFAVKGNKLYSYIIEPYDVLAKIKRFEIYEYDKPVHIFGSPVKNARLGTFILTINDVLVEENGKVYLQYFLNNRSTGVLYKTDEAGVVTPPLPCFKDK